MNALSSTVVRWWMVTSLLGTFSNFSVSFQSINPLGDPSLSLVQSVRVHSLIHNVRLQHEGITLHWVLLKLL